MFEIENLHKNSYFFNIKITYFSRELGRDSLPGLAI
jgi:hypothetical protein